MRVVSVVVVGPHRLDQALRDDLVADRELHPGGELLLADRLRGQPDGDVVVAGLVAPRRRSGSRR